MPPPPPLDIVGVIEKISTTGGDIPTSCNPPINGTLNKLSKLSLSLSVSCSMDVSGYDCGTEARILSLTSAS
jgi:hypothetical protein